MRLLATVSASALLHGAAIAAVPEFRVAAVAAVESITVDFEVVAPEPPPPAPEPEPVKVGVSRPVKAPTTPEPPVAAVEPPPSPAPAAAPSDEPPASGLSLDPSANGTLVAALHGVPGGKGTRATAAPPPSSVEGTPGIDVGALKRAYIKKLNEAVHREYNYPRRAKRAGIQGKVWVEVVLDAAGEMRAVKVHRSCGHQELDQAALETVRAVGKFPAAPPELGWRTQAVRIPLDYSIHGSTL